MTTDGEAKFSYLLLGLALGAVGGLVAAMLSRKETRAVIFERSGKSLDYLNQQVRETADLLVQQGKKLIDCKGSDKVVVSTAAEKQAYQEDKRENQGG
jgi:ketopantoate reductase